MKRAFSFLLAVVMLAALFAVPALAYDTSSNEGLWPSKWHAELNIAFDDATASPLRPLQYTQSHNFDEGSSPEAINPDLAAQSRKGALYLTNNAKFSAATKFVRNTLTAGQPEGLDNHNFVTAAGSTIDFGVKFTALPKASDDIIKIDADGNFTTAGISSTARGMLGRYLGFNINLHSMSDFINPDGSVKVHPSGSNKDKPYSTEYNLSFVAYDNEKLGTNAAIIFITGSATGWTSWTSSVRNVYFCNLDIGRSAKYQRFTLTTDYAKGLAGEDMVTLYIDGKKATTFEAPAYRAYSATLGDSLTMGLYTNGYCEAAAHNGEVSLMASLDQFSVYGTALTPVDGTMSTFKEEAPLYREEFKETVEAAKAIDPTLYSKKSWKAVETALKKADKLPAVDEMNKDNVTQEELDAIVHEINSAIENLKYNDFNSVVEEKRIFVPYSFFNPSDPTGYAYAWTNATILFSDPDYDISEYKVNGADLTNFTSVVFEKVPNDDPAAPEQYKVTKIYLPGTKPESREINKAPKDGFILYSNKNVPGNSTSRYASQLFGDDNADVIAQLQVGTIVELENITLNDDAAATLVTSGQWLSRYDPRILNSTVFPTSTGAVCDDVLVKYPLSDPKWQDCFEDFTTASALVMQLPLGADMEDFNEVMGKIDTLNELDYTAKTWKSLQKVLAKVDLEREDLTQDMIDSWTDDLNEAFEGLKKIEVKEPEEDKKEENAGTGENTGDTDFVLITLAVIGLLAIGCMTVLVIGRRRGNF